MQKIGDSTSTANALGEYTQGQPGSGIDATMITAAWLNAVQRELANLVVGSGQALTPSDDNQVLKAVKALQEAASTWSKLSGKPTTVSGFGLTDAFTKSETNAAILKAVADLVASSPAALDTLKELADALGNDPNFATTMTNALAAKAPLVSPNLTGTPQAPTAPDGDNSARIANTNFVYLAFNRLLVSATEAIKGLARFATQSEVNAGVDDSSIVTPKKLRAGFQIQLSVNGYIYFPSWMGGLVWQWGNRAFTSGSTSAFTTPFPNEALIVWALPNSIVGGSPSTVAVNVQSLNQQSMILSWTAGGTYNFFWFALGR